MLSATQSQRDLFKAVANPVKTDFQQQPQREQRRSASFYEPRGDGLQQSVVDGRLKQLREVLICQKGHEPAARARRGRY